ncbi:MAG: hypothetical protein ACRDQY_17340, partial [Pseudonocardiaceae bacterium]
MTDGGGQLLCAYYPRVSFDQARGDGADGGPVADLAWCLTVRSEQRPGGLLGVAALPPSSGQVGVETPAAFRHGDRSRRVHGDDPGENLLSNHASAHHAGVRPWRADQLIDPRYPQV